MCDEHTFYLCTKNEVYDNTKYQLELWFTNCDPQTAVSFCLAEESEN